MATSGRPPVAIDILTSTAGLKFEEAWNGRTIVRLNGHRVSFLGLREYIKTKRACGRPKDLLQDVHTESVTKWESSISR